MDLQLVFGGPASRTEQREDQGIPQRQARETRARSRFPVHLEARLNRHKVQVPLRVAGAPSGRCSNPKTPKRTRSRPTTKAIITIVSGQGRIDPAQGVGRRID